MQDKFQALKERRLTREVMVGNVGIGGLNPIRVQTMTNTDTMDVEATVKQAIECIKAGSELVRITTQTPAHVASFAKIKEKLRKNGYDVPLIADIHFLPAAAYEAIKYADKVRINPGNFLPINAFNGLAIDEHSYQKELEIMEDSIVPFLNEAKKYDVALRIGANQGSLAERILTRYGDTAKGMVESVMEYLRIFAKHNFHKTVVALKSSDPLTMIEANRYLAYCMDQEGFDYPIHLGVTEAGNAEDGRAKSTLGIGVLLLEGIGDTLRVSLTEAPAKELPVCYSILQATHRRITKTEFISCPSCGRTMYDIETVTNKIKERLSHLQGVTIAIMGCIVNGLGEMANADFAYVGGRKGMVNLYFKKELVKENVDQEQALDELINLIKEKGYWKEPS